jgi:DNA mismatch endonuclease (patch repair protein)
MCANAAVLTAQGWRVVTVWECTMKATDFGRDLIAEIRPADRI